LARSLTPRLIAAIVMSVIPPAVALFVLAANGAINPEWAALAVAIGLGSGSLLGAGLIEAWRQRAERLEAMAQALERRQPPSHLIPDERDLMSRAERRMLEAADAIAAEIETLDEQREEFDAILRSMAEAVVVTGRRGEVMLLNGAARRLFGLLPESDYRGRDLVELCRDPRLQEFVGKVAASDQNEVITAELAIQHPAPRNLEVSAAPVRYAEGVAAARVFVFHDITRLKSFETVRSDFVANLTHELRTPLTALYGYAETLQKGVDDPAAAQRFLGIIERQSRRLARLIDDLISLSDLERGLTPLKIEPLPPGRVLEEAAELMREQARRAGIAFEVRAPKDLPEIAADRDRTHQVMLNLLDNAIKYTPRGGGVTIEARASMGGATINGGGAPARPGVEFVVADTGEGIPAADIPRLTERFYRVDRARSRELGGTGLGLAIVKHIIQLHHGAIKIESRLREGTTVTAWLPLAQ
jgi:two-component system phosphate regulon sensor histidine kinase PhoR